MTNKEGYEHAVEFRDASNHRFHLLDGLRGIIAMVVVLFHMPVAIRPWLPSFDGWMAVDFFFCLSGFVIAFSYERKLREGMKLDAFLTTRIIRLYPLYLSGLAAGAITSIPALLGGSLARLPVGEFLYSCVTGLLVIPYASDNWPIRYSFPLNVPAWSLFYELMANYLFALGIRFKVARSVFLASIAVFSFCAWVANAHDSAGSLHVGDMLASVGPGFARIGFSFTAGILMFRLYARKRRPKSSGLLLLSTGLLSSVMVGLLLLPYPMASSLWYQGMVIVVLFPLVVYLGACTASPTRLVPWCVSLGNISYPLYILHSPMLSLLAGRKALALIAAHRIPIGLWTGGAILALLFIAHLAAGGDTWVRKKLGRRYNAHSRKRASIPDGAADTLRARTEQ